MVVASTSPPTVVGLRISAQLGHHQPDGFGATGSFQRFDGLLDAPADPSPIPFPSDQIHVASFGENVYMLGDRQQAAGSPVVGVVQVDGPAPRVVFSDRLAYDGQVLHFSRSPRPQFLGTHGPPGDLLVDRQFLDLLFHLLPQTGRVQLVLIRSLVVERDVGTDVGDYRPVVGETTFQIGLLIAVHRPGQREAVGQIPSRIAGIPRKNQLPTLGLDAVCGQVACGGCWLS